MFANTFSNIGWTLAILVFIGVGIGLFINSRTVRPEVGSEIELAPNRKRYLDDEELETKQLDRTLVLGLLFLGAIAVALPLYWLYEPARQEGAVEQYNELFAHRGGIVYDTTAKCVECHGPKGVGGAKETALLNDEGEFVTQVKWQAPALNDVLYRYSVEEVRFILNYGRGNTPMPAWGIPGGGPLTEQQIDSTIAYLRSIQIPVGEARAQFNKELELVCRPEREKTTADGTPDATSPLKGVNPKCTVDDPGSPGKSHRWETVGEAIFNMGYYDGFAGGAYSCGRCHTKGWSYGKAENAGGGFFGPNITNGSELRQFETSDSQVNYVSLGSVAGAKYGRGGLSGAGQMPGFGENPNTNPKQDLVPPIEKMEATQSMLTQDMIAAVVAYERTL